MSAEDLLLPHLVKVRRRGTGQWSACCPAHDDKGPSLSIKETSDGRILLHCFAGCEVASIVQSIGLDLSDLFPPDLGQMEKGKRVPRPHQRPRLLAPLQALELIEQEALIVVLAASEMHKGHQLSEHDRERLIYAAARIQALVSEARL